MDGTLLLLLVISGLLIAMLAPHTTLTLVAIVALSVVATRGSWAIVRSFEDPTETRRAVD